MVRNRQTLFVRIVFLLKNNLRLSGAGVFSIGYRGFRHLDTLLDGSNDFDETLIEYGPGLHPPGGMGGYPRIVSLRWLPGSLKVMHGLWRWKKIMDKCCL